MKLCPYPFSRLQTNHTDGSISAMKEAFFPCCPSWFTEEYHQIQREDNLEDIWNGKAAVELRKRMYEGDFSFCNRATCQIPLFTVEELADRKVMFVETPISEENIEAIRRKDPVMPNPPSSLHLSADLTCNLTCASCRPKVIPNTRPSKAAQDEADYVRKLKDHVEIIKMSSGGEVFYSTLQRQLLKSFNVTDFPKLNRIHIVSNGTLFNQKTYNDLAPGTHFIKDVSISLDAGSKEVYEQIRGPYWEQVVSNLKWMSEMRKGGRFDFLSLNFIMQKGNFRDIPNLVKLGKELNVDRILVQRYLAYPDQGFKTEEEQLEQSVHLPTHPDYQEMVGILEKFKDEPKLYTLLDIPGFEKKIKTAVDIQKGKGLLFRAGQLFKLKMLPEALKAVEESIAFYPLVENIELEAQIQCAANPIKDSYFFLLNEAFAAGRKNEFSRSMEMFEKAMMIEPIERSGMAVKGFFFFLMKAGYLERDEKNFLKAETYFREALKHEDIERKGEAANALYFTLMELGQNKKDQGELAQSLLYFQEAFFLQPEDRKGEASSALYYTLVQLGHEQKEKGFITEALECFKEALTVEPKERKGEASVAVYYTLMALGHSANTQGETKRSSSFFREALEYEPDERSGEASAALYFSLMDMGFKSKESRDHSTSLSCFSEAKTHEPEEKKGEAAKFEYYALMDSGLDAKDKGLMEEARNFFYLAAEIEPNDKKGDASKSHYYLLMDQGFKEKSARRFEEAIDLFISSKEFEPSEKAGEADQFRYYALIDSGLVRKEKGELEDALLKFKEAGAIEPPEKAGHAQMVCYCALMEAGFAESEAQSFDKALVLIQRAREIEPKEKKGDADKFIGNMNYLRYRDEGFILQRNGAYAGAVKKFNEALKWQEADADLLFSLGVSLKRIKHFEEAEACFKKAIAAKPGHYWTLLELGYLDLRKNKREGALMLFYSAEAVEPADRQGHTKKYIKLAKRNPNFNSIRRTLQRLFR